MTERLTDKIINRETREVLAYTLKSDLEYPKINVKAIQKLGRYEDAEEDGRLVVLPCKVGDIVYKLCECNDGTYKISPMEVGDVCPYGSPRRNKEGKCEVWNIYATSDYTYLYASFYDIGKTVFLTREKAEKALKEMENA